MTPKDANQTIYVWGDKGIKFWSKWWESWLKENDIQMYTTHNEWKSVVSGRLIRTLRNKIYEYMTSVLKYW